MVVLRNTEGVLACAACRNHYKVWKQAHPLEEFVGRDKYSFKEMLRRWIWELHESVNDDKQVPAERRMPFERLISYKEIPRYEIAQSIATLKDLFQKSVLHRQLNAVYVKEWLRTLNFLQKLMF